MSQSIYFQRYAYPTKYLDVDWVAENPHLIVVLPAYDEPDLLYALQSLEACKVPVERNVSVIVVINASSQAPQEVKDFNLSSYEEVMAWSEGKNLQYHFILENELPKKHAGVGLARKIGMDEAAHAFHLLGRDGVILCFDADSGCAPNLLEEVLGLFESDDKIPGCSIYYEHPLSGELSDHQYQGVVGYELHLRYYIDALRWAGFPYAYQTIGSSMAVRSSAYIKQGGMNRRKAGEDFYFLHRIIPLGDFKDLSTTCIYPSARKSDRVPFGTGKAIGDWMQADSGIYPTYNPLVFEDLKKFLVRVNDFYGSEDVRAIYRELPESFHGFCPVEEFVAKINEIETQSTSYESFEKRFFQWFDGFKVLKYVHFARDHYYPNVTVGEACDWLFAQLGLENHPHDREKLLLLRQRDRAEDLS